MNLLMLAVSLSTVTLSTLPLPRLSDDGTSDRLPTLVLTQVKNSQAVDPKKTESDEEVLRFVGQHQPKLLELLNFLKAKQSPQYKSAMREMSRSKMRLEVLSKKDQELYGIELELWQIRSKQRLVAAEISVASSRREELQKQLERLVAEELDKDIERLKLQQSRATKLAQQLESQIQQQQESREDQITKALKLWQNRIAKDKN